MDTRIIFRKKIIYHNRNPLLDSKILLFFLKNTKIITISKYLKKIKSKISLVYNPIFINNLKQYHDIKKKL